MNDNANVTNKAGKGLDVTVKVDFLSSILKFASCKKSKETLIKSMI